MMLDLLIDGYNLMHFAGLARPRYGPQGLQRARFQLLKRLQRQLSKAERMRTTIVFDGTYADFVPDDTETLDTCGFDVIFSRQGEEADDVIEAIIRAHSAPKQLLVVSSDHRLQKAARRRRAASVDSDVFLEELEQRGSPTQSVPRKRPSLKETGSLSAEDITHWEQEFDTIDVQQIAQEVQAEPPLDHKPPQQSRKKQQKKRTAKKPDAASAAAPGNQSPRNKNAEEPSPLADATSAKPRELSAEELLEWQTAFGDIDVDAIEDEVRHETQRQGKTPRKPDAPS